MKLTSSLAVLSLAAFGVACSGGSSSSIGGSGGLFSQIGSQFIDGPVKGIDVCYNATEDCSTNPGLTKTGARGAFKCTRGEGLAFFVGALKIGEGTCGDKVFLSDVAGSDATGAAQIILSLAKIKNSSLDIATLTGSEELDVSELSIDFAGLTTIGSVVSDWNDVEVNGAPAGAIIDTAIAEAHIAKAVVANSSLDFSQFAQIYNNLPKDHQQVPTGKLIKALANRTSGDPEECAAYVGFTAQITKDTISTTDIYRLKPIDSAYWDDESGEPDLVVTTGLYNCPNDLGAGYCETYTPVASEKVISSAKMSFDFLSVSGRTKKNQVYVYTCLSEPFNRSGDCWEEVDGTPSEPGYFFKTISDLVFGESSRMELNLNLRTGALTGSYIESYSFLNIPKNDEIEPVAFTNPYVLSRKVESCRYSVTASSICEDDSGEDNPCTEP